MRDCPVVFRSTEYLDLTIKPTHVLDWFEEFEIDDQLSSDNEESTVYGLIDKGYALKVFSFYDNIRHYSDLDTYQRAMEITARLYKLFHEKKIGPKLPSSKPFWYVRTDEKEYGILMKQYDGTAVDYLNELEENDRIHLGESIRSLLSKVIEMGFVYTDCKPDNFLYDNESKVFVIGDISTVGVKRNNHDNDNTILGACLQMFDLESKREGLPPLFEEFAEITYPNMYSMTSSLIPRL